MPAHKKPAALHKLQGTFQPCRHAEQPAKPAKTKPKTPGWLPDNAKKIYRRLLITLSGCSAVEEITLCQLALLRAKLQDNPERFTASEHSQLRQLVTQVQLWPQASDEPEDDFEVWHRHHQEMNRKKRQEQEEREALRAKCPAIR